MIRDDPKGAHKLVADGSFRKQTDLVWGLKDFKNKQQAASFFNKVSSGICVYSSDVEALYTNYTVDFCMGSKSLIVLPNPFASYDTLHGIRSRAVIPTGIHVIQRRSQFWLLIPIRRKSSNVRNAKLYEFSEGVNLIKKLLGGREFIPVVKKGDLREHGEGSPKIHLHRLHEPEMSNLSGLDISSTRRVVADRFERLVDASSAPT